MARSLGILGLAFVIILACMGTALMGKIEEAQLRGPLASVGSEAANRAWVAEQPTAIIVPGVQAGENWIKLSTVYGDYRITEHAYARHAEVAEIAEALGNGWHPTKHHCKKNGRDMLIGLVFRAGAAAGRWAVVILESPQVATGVIVTAYYPQPISDPRQQLDRIVETMHRDGCGGVEQFETILHTRWALQ